MADLTHGSKAVGITFNPGKNTEVNDIKTKAAAFIDSFTGEAAEKLAGAKSAAQGEVIAMRKLAQRAAQEASMWAVKAATWIDAEAKKADDSTDNQANDGGVAAPNAPTGGPSVPGASAATGNEVADPAPATSSATTASALDATNGPANAGHAAGVANPNAVPQTAPARQPETAGAVA
jgi:hypothetical protein